MALLLACATCALIVVAVVVPHIGDCAGDCEKQCRASPGTIERLVCESECRARCTFARTRDDVIAEGSPSRGGTKIRVGDVEVAAPELNFPISELAKAALQFRAPLAKPARPKVSSVDLRPELSRRGIRIEDQKDTQTCMAHALTSAMEYALVPAFRKDPSLARGVGAPLTGPNLSRRHVHFVSLHAAIVCRRDYPRGSWVLHAASAVAADGTFLESHWPFVSWDPMSPHWKTCEEAVNGGEPSGKALAERKLFLQQFKYLPPFGLDTVASARNTGHLEGILDLGYPIVLAVVLIQPSFDAAWRNGGYVRSPKAGTKAPATLHYVLVVGFDRGKKLFTFANSWGRKFGSSGYGFLEYDYVERFGIEGLYVEEMRVAGK
jgi:hypothetical protein